MKNLILLSLMTSMFFSLFLSQSSAEVTLIVGDGSGLPGSLENPVTVSLNDPNDEAKAVQVDVCDVDNYLSCTACETTERTTGFECETNELSNGCCRIVLFSLGGNIIEEGTGPVFTINYDVLAGAPSGNCIELNPEGIEIADETGAPFTNDVVTESGQFCFPTSSSTTTSIEPTISPTSSSTIAPTTTPTTSPPETTTTVRLDTTTTTMQPPLPTSTSSSSTTPTKSFLNDCALLRVYGENSVEVELLRYIRDNILSQNPEGRELIKMYYQWSPVIIAAMENDEEFREEVREIIDGVLGLVTEVE